MDKKNTKELAVVKLSIIDRIKNIFKKLFSSNKEQEKEMKEVQEKQKENTFITSIKIEENDEEKRLLKLQTLISEDVITEEELPQKSNIPTIPEDIKALHQLYDKQILELKKSIDDYREKILKLRMNISE